MSRRDVNDENCVQPDRSDDLLGGLRTDALSNERLVALAAYFDAASNETRLRILYVLHRAGELCVCDLADIFEITQPSVSRHLKILREKALVEARRDAQTIYYSVCTDNAFARMLVEFFDEKDTAPITLNVNPTEATS
ncbi:DNA-binding transcriptional ArsR family regulator [Salinibacter ruber]|jgi:DNA-binding transcriptional ArsR family regulator|uniref:DNA-binding transcriptional ArsR family regulator n=1 Tax=Salinibacter ruber TaxID=146919 RepID=A0A9X2Q1C0_9BACT|nr:metalloregulator ArsR/SmtB family transcription factor [Salinibacter ruber]MCS3635717.1 DNA-binding transcriptional ArsR family regulator [Salinibacter ruber]MCS3638765.1 DNA-binding transcriptional ArsR family regulator [Salinibacter ruber]MCS3660012.1 DNA-binding transcriptional ArsR family regulator [Salinibacter ruber]MCS3709697.1 DNA-binding transcriptional ArsR family regulator [Salinibacter ruber]MCS3715192.1 DNA-binding transcriptional ArsR family regulator [Salinibacter ruber]